MGGNFSQKFRGGGKNVRLVPILETGPVPKSGIEEIGGKNFLKNFGGEDNFRLVPFSDIGPVPKTVVGEIGEKNFSRKFWGGGGKKFPVSTIFGDRSCSKNRNRRDSGKKKFGGRTNFWLVPFSETSPNPITEKGKKNFWKNFL